jgi:hypothetical protein
MNRLDLLDFDLSVFLAKVSLFENSHGKAKTFADEMKNWHPLGSINMLEKRRLINWCKKPSDIGKDSLKNARIYAREISELIVGRIVDENDDQITNACLNRQIKERKQNRKYNIIDLSNIKRIS